MYLFHTSHSLQRILLAAVPLVPPPLVIIEKLDTLPSGRNVFIILGEIDPKRIHFWAESVNLKTCRVA